MTSAVAEETRDRRSEVAKASEEEDCHVCQPFTSVVRDPAKFQACMKRAKDIGELSNPKNLYLLVREDLERQDQEVFVVVCMDFRGQLRDYVMVGMGQRHRVAVDVEDILRPVILSGCDGFAVCHVHPSGIAEPSDADGKLTEAIKQAAKTACPSVHFLDHLVVAGGTEGKKGSYYSFASSGWKVSGKPVEVT